MKPLPRFRRCTLPVCSLFFALFSLLSASSFAQELDCQPCRHGFGKIQAGSSKTFNVNLTNSGKRSLKITADPVQGSEFSVGTFPLPMTLKPGAHVQLPVIFTPTAAGRVTGSVTLANNGQDSQLEIKLAGTGVAQGSHSVALTWLPGDENYAGFNVYRATTQGGPYSKINSQLDTISSYTDSEVAGGATYYYAATEVDAQGEESAYSNIAVVTIPGS
ncbi:MAG TPA: choice-of-anchor D domain-containing protein [Terriglobales bacterium]|nr:choice-of-anchor D domain-containing protein [Terriglobales bacterium]